MLYIDLCMFPSLISFGSDVLFMSLLCPFHVLFMSFPCPFLVLISPFLAAYCIVPGSNQERVISGWLAGDYNNDTITIQQRYNNHRTISDHRNHLLAFSQITASPSNVQSFSGVEGVYPDFSNNALHTVFLTEITAYTTRSCKKPKAYCSNCDSTSDA